MAMDKDTNVQKLKDALRKFRDDRDWAQFHDPKNLAEAISIEAAELQEHFLWKEREEAIRQLREDAHFREEVGEDLADVFIFCMNFANAADMDVSSLILDKVEKSNKKYPVEKSKGKATKYNKL